jgi:hypothetical protein
MFRFGLMLGLFAAFSLQAATLQQLSIDEITASSTAIVQARIVSAGASFTGNSIYTHYRLQVAETLKGNAPAEFVLPGGVAGHYRQSFPGVPMLSTGTEYVLFLWTSTKSGLTFPVGFSQGILNVARRTNGTVELSRPRIGEMMLDAGGKPAADHPPSLRLKALRERITALHGGGAAR